MESNTLPEALRQAADLIEAHPELPTPVVTTYSSGTVNVAWQLMNDAATETDQKAAARLIIRAIGGKWDKREYGGDTFYFDQTFGLLELSIYATREQVCERIVTGTETVTIAAKPAEPERVEEREIVEWRCEPILAEAVSA